MTDETTVTPSDEEPGGSGNAEAQQQDVAEQPTGSIPVANAGLTQTAAHIDKFSAATDAQFTHTDATQAAPGQAASTFSTASAFPEIPQARVYEQFGGLQSHLYSNAIPAAPANIVLGNSTALPVQNVYAPYSGQPGQFYPGQPGLPAAPKKRRRAVLWAAIVILAILLFGGTATLTYALTQPQAPSPNAALRAYCQAVKAGDAQGLYNLLSQQARVHTSLDDIESIFNTLNTASALGIKYSACTFDNVRVSGSLAVATISLTVSMSFQGQSMSIITPSLVSLVLENNQWKIDFSNFAQPEPKFNLPSFLTPTTTSN